MVGGRKSGVGSRGSGVGGREIANNPFLQTVSHPAMNPFFSVFIASLGVAIVWSFLVLTLDTRKRHIAGLTGAWAATLVLAAFWQAEAIPWLWVFLKAVLLVWLGAIALLVAAVVSIWRLNQPARRPLLCCALSSLAINLAAAVQLLWQATVSPGGI